MAQSINLRTRLSLPPLSLGTDPTPQQLAKAMEDLQRNLSRWSEALPFGAAGFSVRRTNNHAAVNNGVTSTIGFNAAIDDQEGWAGTASSGAEQGGFICPPGLSGWYMCVLNVMVDAVASDWAISIQRYDLSLTATGYGLMNAISNDRIQVSALIPVRDGEVLASSLVNLSGAARTITYFAQTTVHPWWPSFTCRRVSLL